MRALVCEQLHAPWILKELPDPSPGPGEVLVQARASGLCVADVVTTNVYPPYLPAVPYITGHEFVGDVVAVGSGVTSRRVGDRVVVACLGPSCGSCDACKTQQPCMSPINWTLSGGNVELLVASAQGCLVLPDNVTYEDAAPLFCGGFTAMSAIRLGSIQAGERVAVLGIGGIGHLAVQCCKALGFETIALTSSAGKQKEARQLGADEVVITGGDPGAALHKAGGADVILSTVDSSEQVERAMSGLRFGGRMVSIGLCGTLRLDTRRMLLNSNQFSICHSWKIQDLLDVMTLAAQNKVKPKVEIYPFDRFNEAVERIHSGQVTYRAVLQHRKS